MQAGSKNSVKVHAMVRKEAVIFRRHDGIDDGFGQILIAHQPPLAAGIVKQRGDDFRLEVVARELAVSESEVMAVMWPFEKSSAASPCLNSSP